MKELPIGYMELETMYARTFGAGVRSLAVASANAGEGVSTVAAALAKRLEVAGQKVLLVELNLFHPQLSQYLNVERHNWLLNDQVAISSVVQRDGFDFLSAPSSPEAPMLFRQQALLQASIHGWLQDYDAVVIDTSPVNAVNKGNIPAELVCSVCDGALMVVMAGQTSESAIREANKRLADAGSKVLGVVINDCYNPSLAFELIREVMRLEKRLPRVSAWLCRKIRESVFLNAAA